MTLRKRINLWAGFFTKISYPRDLALVIQAFSKRRSFQLPGEIWAIIEPVRGFLSVKEAGFLYRAAREWPVAGPVLELGSFEGRSTIVFARAGRVVHAVDAWSLAVEHPSAYGDGGASAEEALYRFQQNIRRAQVETQIHIHRGLTHAVGQHWPTPGALLFIDAGHTYADVKGDLEIWAPHLLPNGLLLMHDVLGDLHMGVTRAASELLQQDWRVVASSGSIVAFTRKWPRAYDGYT